MANASRGFASMDEGKRREIARKGGQASGGNFRNSPDRASEAGKKGGSTQATDTKQRGGHHENGNA